MRRHHSRHNNFKLHKPDGGSPRMPIQPQINLPMAEIAGFTFNVGALIAIDHTCYKPESEAREIRFYLAGPVEHLFEGTRADQAWHWYLQLTGQAKIQEATQQ